ARLLTPPRPPALSRQVRQEELRRLMREKQQQNAGKKRIDSPFAKYPHLGHLSCTLCNAPVKSELLWQTHALGKQHRERVAELKGTKQTATGSAASASSHPVKRKTVDLENTELKRVKGKERKILKSTCQNLAISHPECFWLVFFPMAVFVLFVHRLLSFLIDFFDSKTIAAPIVSHSGSIQKAEIQEKIVERVTRHKSLIMDAPKDQMDKEWDEFQKAMRQVNTISEAIVAEEDEEGRLDRQIGEIDEQIECYRRVELLRNRQDLMKEKLKEAMRLSATQEKEDEAIGSEDEEELQDLLSQDWRVKGALL
uniref:Zinc finger protein 830 n=1 Tax=Strix occidentalis caurina TaxID=311401 RepID=A0A8D0FHF7_STROC